MFAARCDRQGTLAAIDRHDLSHHGLTAGLVGLRRTG
jgi:hypothetical protein